MNELRINNVLIPKDAGWKQTSLKSGVWCEPRVGFQVYGECSIEWNGVHKGFSSRSCVNLRWNEAVPTEFYFAGHGAEDFRDGGLHGISPCGDDDTVITHDRIQARSPVALRDFGNGKLRPLAEITCPNGGYTLDRVGLGSILLGYGAQSLKPYDGQHGIRYLRVAMRHKSDPFVMRNLQEYAHDIALCWNRARANRILSGPKGQGSSEVGREVAWSLLIAVHAGNTTLRDRLVSIIKHVQGAEGHVHVAPEYGNPAPPAGKWASDMEEQFLVIALRAAGANREAAKLAAVCCVRPIGKYIEWQTGRGDQSPTHGTAWAAFTSGVFSKALALECAKRWPMPKPVYMGGVWGPFTTQTRIVEKLREWNEIGKTRSALEMFS